MTTWRGRPHAGPAQHNPSDVHLSRLWRYTFLFRPFPPNHPSIQFSSSNSKPTSTDPNGDTRLRHWPASQSPSRAGRPIRRGAGPAGKWELGRVGGGELMGAASSRLEKALGEQFPEGERYFGLENFGNTCYCNSVLQVRTRIVP